MNRRHTDRDSIDWYGVLLVVAMGMSAYGYCKLIALWLHH